MNKCKKMLALSLVMLMLLGMTAVVFAAEEIIIDTGDSRYSEVGKWKNSGMGGYYKNKTRQNTSGDESQYARYTPNITEAGDYDVYIHKFGKYSKSTTKAKYTVKFDGGSKTYTINLQDPANDVWEKLGTHPFAVGTDGYVELSAAQEGTGEAVEVRADAVKFVKATDSSNPSTGDAGVLVYIITFGAAAVGGSALYKKK